MQIWTLLILVNLAMIEPLIHADHNTVLQYIQCVRIWLQSPHLHLYDPTAIILLITITTGYICNGNMYKSEEFQAHRYIHRKPIVAIHPF